LHLTVVSVRHVPGHVIKEHRRAPQVLLGLVVGDTELILHLGELRALIIFKVVPLHLHGLLHSPLAVALYALALNHLKLSQLALSHVGIFEEVKSRQLRL
jgi:hypothetical protein